MIILIIIKFIIIQSLNGHTTSIDCAKFSHNEDLVCAGSASGALKIWDLEAAKCNYSKTC